MTPGKLLRSTPLFWALFASTAGFAQPAQPLPGFELERLELNPDAKGSLLLGTGELLDPGQGRVSLLAHYQRASLAYFPNNAFQGYIVKDRATAEVAAAYAPLSWLEFAAQVPVVFYQAGDDLTARGIAAVAKAGLDTPIVSARVGLLSQRAGKPLDLALELAVGLPIGSATALGFEGGGRYTPRVLLGRDFGPIRVGAEVGAALRPSPSVRGGAGVSGGVSLSTTGQGLRGELDLFGEVPFSTEASGLEAMLGLRLPLGSVVELFAMGGTGLVSAPGVPRFRALAGIAFTGIPFQASKAIPESKAIPPPPVTPPSSEAPVNRCEPGKSHTPAECPDLDDDGDGVKNGVDRCPIEPGPASNQGCPETATQPPPEKDTSGAKQEVSGNKKLVDGTVRFKTDKADLQPRWFPLLDRVAKKLTDHPDIRGVILAGHADDRGSAEMNQKLSEARAEAVRQYLIDKGVAPGRLEIRGYGANQPVDNNKTAKGRAKNRRVEFIISTGETEKGAR